MSQGAAGPVMREYVRDGLPVRRFEVASDTAVPVTADPALVAMGGLGEGSLVPVADVVTCGRLTQDNGRGDMLVVLNPNKPNEVRLPRQVYRRLNQASAGGQSPLAAVLQELQSSDRGVDLQAKVDELVEQMLQTDTEMSLPELPPPVLPATAQMQPAVGFSLASKLRATKPPRQAAPAAAPQQSQQSQPQPPSKALLFELNGIQMRILAHDVMDGVVDVDDAAPGRSAPALIVVRDDAYDSASNGLPEFSEDSGQQVLVYVRDLNKLYRLKQLWLIFSYGGYTFYVYEWSESGDMHENA